MGLNILETEVGAAMGTGYFYFYLMREGTVIIVLKCFIYAF